MSVDKSQTYRSVWSHLMTTPFRQAYVTAAGLRTRYLEAGESHLPPLLLIHGTGSHWEAYAANIAALAEHFHVYAPDMMGCGFTDKPDRPYEVKDYVAHIVAFMDAVGVERADFIGLSLGTWVCTRLALAHPARAGKLVLVSPTGYFPVRAGAQSLIDARRSSVDNPTWENTAKVLAPMFLEPEKSLADDLVAIRHRIFSLPGMQQILPRTLTLFDPQIRLANNVTDDEWRSLASPVLLIENVDSDDIYLKTARTVVKLLPDARLVPMTGVGHWAQFEDPDTFNRVALEFLCDKEAQA